MTNAEVLCRLDEIIVEDEIDFFWKNYYFIKELIELILCALEQGYLLEPVRNMVKNEDFTPWIKGELK
jgi:hypothetical protein